MRQTVDLHDSDMASILDLDSGDTTLTASIMHSLINSASENDLFFFAILCAIIKLAFVAFFCREEIFTNTFCCHFKL